MSDNGYIKRLSISHLRALLALAYEVSLARYIALTPTSDQFNFRWRISEAELQSRRREIQLYELDRFAYRPLINAQVNTAAESFVSAIDKTRLASLLNWTSPTISDVSGDGQYKVYNAQLAAAIAHHRLPTSSFHFPILKSQPRHQLSLPQCCDLILTVFGDFVAENRDLICRISSSAKEAALLTGYDGSTTSTVREKLGVIEL